MHEFPIVLTAIRELSHEKTEFFPIPALAEEEGSVEGITDGVKSLYITSLLFTTQMIVTFFHGMIAVGDWLTIRNFRLAAMERSTEFSDFEKMNWLVVESMPFHYMLNAIYIIFCTYLGHATTDHRECIPAIARSNERHTCRSKIHPMLPFRSLNHPGSSSSRVVTLLCMKSVCLEALTPGIGV